jgi:hypothetical protein
MRMLEVLSNRYPSGNRIRQRWPRQGGPSRSASERTRHESAEKVAATPNRIWNAAMSFFQVTSRLPVNRPEQVNE